MSRKRTYKSGIPDELRRLGENKERIEKWKRCIEAIYPKVVSERPGIASWMETLREPFEEELGREIRETDFKGLAENLAEKERKQRREEDEEGPDKGTIMGVLEMPYHAVFIGNTFFKNYYKDYLSPVYIDDLIEDGIGEDELIARLELAYEENKNEWEDAVE